MFERRHCIPLNHAPAHALRALAEVYAADDAKEKFVTSSA